MSVTIDCTVAYETASLCTVCPGGLARSREG